MVEYCIDAHDHLVEVNRDWAEFARANQAPGLEPNLVLGRSLWDFIAEPTVRALHGELLAELRRRGGSLTFPFRCDAPELRRYMELTLRGEADGCVRFQARLLRSEPRPAVALLDVTAARSDDFITMCAWCKAIAVPGHGWVQVEEAIQRLGLFDTFPLPKISHAICETCTDTVMKTLRRQA